MKICQSPWPVKSALLVGAFAVALVFGVAGCNGSGGGGVLAPLADILSRAFFPLNTGDTRTYRQTTTAGGAATLTQTVNAPQTVSGLAAFPMTTRQADGSVVRVDYQHPVDPESGEGEGVTWIGSDEGTATLRLTPAVLIPVNLVSGQVVQQTVSATGTGAFDAVKSLTSTVRLVGLTSVTVPAGTFDQCAQIEVGTVFRNQAGNVILQRTATTFLAPRVGIIKVISSLGTTNELTSATVTGVTTP